MSKPQFAINKLSLPGCLELVPDLKEDERGKFVKVFQQSVFSAMGLENHFPEIFYSVSKQGVIRGLHFQIPPFEHSKLIYCPEGWIQDAVVDLRQGSPTYGSYAVMDVSAEKGNLIYIPPGIAHGFCVLSDSAIVMYMVSSQYSPEHDAGILWNSIPVPWLVEEPIVSKRDCLHPRIQGYQSPFRYQSKDDNR